MRRPFVILALLLAAMIGIVRGAAQTADVLNTHVVCAEHGDLVHMSIGATYSGRSELRALAADHHDDCALAGFLAPAVGTAPDLDLAWVDAPAPCATDPPVLLAASAHSSLPLLSRAPKTSPPA